MAREPALAALLAPEPHTVDPTPRWLRRRVVSPRVLVHRGGALSSFEAAKGVLGGGTSSEGVLAVPLRSIRASLDHLPRRRGARPP